jgi:hypothetical protein
MNAIPPSLTPDVARPVFGQSTANASSLKWAALQDAANVVASLAGLEPEPAMSEIRNFPALIRDAAPWRRDLAERGIDDMAAVMAPGIAALLGVSARDADPRPAALALWRDFVAARDAILALLPPGEMHGAPL